MRGPIDADACAANGADAVIGRMPWATKAAARLTFEAHRLYQVGDSPMATARKTRSSKTQKKKTTKKSQTSKAPGSTRRSKKRGQDEDKVLELLPGGGKALASIHDATADQILELAQQLVANARRQLGANSAKPRAASVDTLFTRFAKKPRRTPAQLDDELRAPEHVEQVAQLDRDWDMAYATALNNFDRVSVASGSKIHDADDAWRLAVRLFESASRSAGAVFKAEVEKARSVTPAPHADDNRDAHVEVAFHTRGSDISEALVTYEQAMATATAGLASALGALITDLFGAVTTTCVGEAERIHATEAASKTFWVGVHDASTSKS